MTKADSSPLSGSDRALRHLEDSLSYYEPGPRRVSGMTGGSDYLPFGPL